MTQIIFSVAASTDDIRVTSTSTGVYPTDGAPFTNATDGYVEAARSTNYRTSVGLMRWDTSSIPDDATIISASFRGYAESSGSTDSLSYWGDWRNGWTGTESYTHSVPTTTAFDPVAISSITNAAYFTITLKDPHANVNKSGFTGLRVGITQRASDAAPTGANAILVNSSNDPTFNPPQLIVNYTASTLPTLPCFSV